MLEQIARRIFHLQNTPITSLATASRPLPDSPILIEVSCTTYALGDEPLRDEWVSLTGKLYELYPRTTC
jgi:hypothetical protein